MSADWKTAAEWAAEGLNGLGKTRQGVEWLAKEDGWRLSGASKARKRKARGGGWEYHISCLPEAARADWGRRVEAAERTQDLETRSADVAAALATAPEALSARRREVMQARAAILLEIERRTINGVGWDNAAKGLLADAVSGALPAYLESTLRLACDRKRGQAPSVRTVYNWKAAQNSGGIQSLAPARSEQQCKAPPPDWLAAVLRHRGKTGVTLAHALDLYAQSLPAGAPVPTYAQAQRALKSLAGTERFLDAHRGRKGPLALKAMLGFRRRTVEGMDPTTVYTADGKTFDASVAHPVSGRPFRPEITTVIDVVTRRVVGWSVGLAENSRGVADALRRACETGGIPAIFYTDNGSGYRNAALDHDTLGIAATLGITTTHSLPYNSQARGIIERANGTIWNRLAQEFVTYQGPLVDREHSQRVYKAIKRDIADFGSSRLLPSWSDFVGAVEAAIAHYNGRPHRSLRLTDPGTGRKRSASPDEVWADFVTRGFAPVELQSAEADGLFRPTIRRKVARGEVQYLGNQYFHQALEPYHGMEVLVGIDIQDASRVWVRQLDLIDGAPQPGALICVAGYWANKTRYMPVSMEQAAKEKRAKSRLRRVDDKREAIEAEAGDALMIEHMPQMPVTLVSKPQPELVSTEPARELRVERPGLPGRKVQSCYVEHDEVELAAEMLADPSQLTVGRRRLLNEFIRGSRHADELLRAGGVDPDELENLLRSAAA